MRASIEACAAFGRTIRTRTLRTAPAAVGTRCRLSRLEPTKARADRAEPGGGMEIARRPSWPRIPSVDAQNAQSAERARRPLDIHRLCFWTPMRPSSQSCMFSFGILRAHKSDEMLPDLPAESRGVACTEGEGSRDNASDSVRAVRLDDDVPSRRSWQTCFRTRTTHQSVPSLLGSTLTWTSARSTWTTRTSLCQHADVPCIIPGQWSLHPVRCSLNRPRPVQSCVGHV